MELPLKKMFKLYQEIEEIVPENLDSFEMIDFVQGLINYFDNHPGSYIRMLSFFGLNPKKFMKKDSLVQLDQLIQIFNEIKFFDFLVFIRQWQ